MYPSSELDRSTTGRQLQDSMNSFAQQETKYVATARTYKMESEASFNGTLEHIHEKESVMLKLIQLIEQKSYVIQQNHNERTEAKNLFEEQSTDTGINEKTLKGEIQQTKDQLETLYIFMNRDNEGTFRTIDDIQDKLNQEQLKLNQMESDKISLSNQIETIEKNGDIYHLNEVNKFQVALESLDDAEQVILSQQSVIHKRINDKQTNKDQSEHHLQFIIEDVKGTTTQINELSNELSSLNQKINQQKEQHSEIASYFEKQIENNKNLKQLKKGVTQWKCTKTEIQSQRHSHIIELNNINRDIDQINKSIIDSKDLQSEAKRMFRERVIEIEELIGIDVIDKAILGVIESRGYSLEFQFKRLQIKLLEKENIIYQESVIPINIISIEKIKQMEQDIIEQHQLFIQSMKGEHSMRKKKIGAAYFEESLKEELHLQIQNLKQTKKEFLETQFIQQLKGRNVERGIEQLRRQLRIMSKEIDLDEQDINNMLRVDALTKHEIVIISHVDELIIKEMIDGLSNKEIQLGKLLDEERELIKQSRVNHKRRIELLQLIGTMNEDELMLSKRALLYGNQTNQLGNKMGDKDAKMELGILEGGTDSYDIYTEDHSQDYMKFKREEGQTAQTVLKMKDKHSISEVASYQQKKMFNIIHDSYYRRETVLLILLQKNSDLDDHYKQVKQQTIIDDNIQIDLDKLNSQMDCILEAEKELSQEVVKQLQQKKETIQVEINQMFHDSSYNILQEKLNGVTIGLLGQNNTVKNLQFEIQFQQQSQDINDQSGQKDRDRLNGRLTQLEKAKLNLKQQVKPQLKQLDEHIKTLTNTIIKDRKVSESWFQKFIGALDSLKPAYDALDDFNTRITPEVITKANILMDSIKNISYQVTEDNLFIKENRQETEGFIESEEIESKINESLVLQSLIGNEIQLNLLEMAPTEADFFTNVSQQHRLKYYQKEYQCGKCQKINYQINKNNLINQQQQILKCVDLDSGISFSLLSQIIYKYSNRIKQRISQIEVSTIMKIVVPQQTLDILKVMKKNQQEQILTLGTKFVDKQTNRMKKFDRDIYTQCKWFEFEIITTGKTYNFVMSQSFQTAVKGLQRLVKEKSNLRRLSKKVDVQ